MKRPTLTLILFAAACRRTPPPPSPPHPAAPHATTAPPTPQPGAPPASSIDPPASPAAFRESGRFLPAAVPGWVQSGEVKIVNGRELFQLIDGAGEKYLSYGFRQLGRTDYRKAGTELVVTAEVYDMSSPLGAFGQYSMLLSDSRDPSTMQSRAINLGRGGFLGTSQLVFWQGQYLIQVNLADDSGEQGEEALAATAREALPAVATSISRALPAESDGGTSNANAPLPLPESRVLPAQDLVWGGATYLTDNVLGLEQTGPGWVGHYGVAAGQRYRVAVMIRGSVADAHALLQTLRGASSSAVAGVGDEAFTNAGIAAARRGTTVVAVGGPAPATLPTLPLPARVERLRSVIAALP